MLSTQIWTKTKNDASKQREKGGTKTKNHGGVYFLNE